MKKGKIIPQNSDYDIQVMDSDLLKCNISDSLKVLIVEDNPTNVKLNLLLLEKIGIKIVEVAENGQIALDILSDEAFDLILMDMQMPVMDGLEASQHIRDMGISTPIIAITANALKGDKEKCIKAGMNDYITKPIKRSKLYDVILKYTSDCISPENTTEKSIETNEIKEIKETNTMENTVNKRVIHDDIFNLEDALVLVDEDMDLLNDIASVFLEESDKQVEEVEQAISDRDSEKIFVSAHTLKGSVVAFGKKKAYEVTLKLEMMGRNNDLSEVEGVFSELKNEIEKLRNVLQDYAA